MWHERFLDNQTGHLSEKRDQALNTIIKAPGVGFEVWEDGEKSEVSRMKISKVVKSRWWKESD